jgi:hypothetical protein
MKENKAEEKLRIIDVIKENSAAVIAIGGFIWIVYSAIVLPIKALEYQVGDIIGNHLKTIQDEQVTATAERKAQTEMLMDISSKLIRLETIVGK